MGIGGIFGRGKEQGSQSGDLEVSTLSEFEKHFNGNDKKRKNSDGFVTPKLTVVQREERDGEAVRKALDLNIETIGTSGRKLRWRINLHAYADEPGIDDRVLLTGILVADTLQPTTYVQVIDPKTMNQSEPRIIPLQERRDTTAKLTSAGIQTFPVPGLQ